MKNKNYLIVFLISISIVFATTSCNKIVEVLDKDTEFVSDTSFTPIFELNEGELMVLQMGVDTWSEPGVKSCIAGDEDLTSSVVIDDNGIDDTKRGLYTISYSATNKYGLKETIFRSVLITEGVNDLYDISGTYNKGPFAPDKRMNITPAEVKGFWQVGDINDGSKENPKPALIADLGDKTYVIVRNYWFKKVTLVELYAQGTAVFDESQNSIVFSIETVQYETDELEQQFDKYWYKE